MLIPSLVVAGMSTVPVPFSYAYLLYFTTVLPQQDFFPTENSVAFPGESQLRQGRATQPTVHAGYFSVSIIHRTLTRTTGSLTCAQMLMHAIAQGVRTHVRESALEADWEKNPLPHRGIEPASASSRSDALPTELHPHLKSFGCNNTTTAAMCGLHVFRTSAKSLKGKK